MSGTSQPFIAGTVIVGIAVLVLCFIGMVTGIRINTTKSFPQGLYLMRDSFFKKGDLVIFCPPKSDVFDEALKRDYIGAGFCKGGYGYVMKRIVAVTDDVVAIDDTGVYVNGVRLNNSKLYRSDKSDRRMPYYPKNNFVLGRSELMLMSDVNEQSFDSRYFGPIDCGQIQGVVSPIFTW